MPLEVRDQVADEIGEVEPLDVLGLEQPTMHGSDCVQPLQHARQRGADASVAAAAALQQHQRRDELEVVLDPVVELVKQGGTLPEDLFQVAGAGRHGRLQLGDPVLRVRRSVRLVGHARLP